MVVKRKRLETASRQENPNPRHLRSGRIVKPTDKALKSWNSKLVSSKEKETVETDIAENSGDEDQEVSRPPKSLKVLKLASSSHQPLSSTRDAVVPRGMRFSETRSVGLSTYKKANRLRMSISLFILYRKKNKRIKQMSWRNPFSGHQNEIKPS